MASTDLNEDIFEQLLGKEGLEEHNQIVEYEDYIKQEEAKDQQRQKVKGMCLTFFDEFEADKKQKRKETKEARKKDKEEAAEKNQARNKAKEEAGKATKKKKRLQKEAKAAAKKRKATKEKETKEESEARWKKQRKQVEESRARKAAKMQPKEGEALKGLLDDL